MARLYDMYVGLLKMEAILVSLDIQVEKEFPSANDQSVVRR